MRRILLSAIATLVAVPFAVAHPGHHFNLKSATPKTLASLPAMGTKGTVSADKKTLTFTGKAIRLIVTTGPEKDMLSYRIQGLRNPTLVIPRGATLNVLFVNSDDDMKHNFRFADDQPPFAAKPTLKNSAGSHDLAPGKETSRHAEALVVVGPTEAGKFSYVCTVPGHAAGGMYGLVVVR